MPRIVLGCLKNKDGHIKFLILLESLKKLKCANTFTHRFYLIFVTLIVF